MNKRLIKGLDKKEFSDLLIKKANELNPEWRGLFGKSYSDKDFMTCFWHTPLMTGGFALTPWGHKFMIKVLNVTPHTIDGGAIDLLNAHRILKLAKYMPWPYRVESTLGSTKLHLFSEEVAVWAALYGNNLDAIIDLYVK